MPRSQLQLMQANCKITTITPLPTSTEWTFGKPYSRAPLPFCLSKMGKWKWKAVPGEKPECPRGCRLPPRAPRPRQRGGSMFYQAVGSRCPTLPANTHPAGKAEPGPQGRARAEKVSPLFYPPCPPQGKQSTKRTEGNLLRGGVGKACHEGKKKKKEVHKWCY